MFACLTSRGWEAHRRREKQVKRSSQSESFAKDRSSEADNQKRSPRTGQPKQPIKSLWRLINRYIRSHSSENLQDRMVIIVSANQINSTVIEPLDHGDILRRIYKIGWSESYRPIRSLRRLLNRYITATFFGESSRSDGQNCIGQSDHFDVT